ncbi:MAG: bacterial proteasome activator family protein [Pseudonocardiaceae bacterium]
MSKPDEQHIVVIGSDGQPVHAMPMPPGMTLDARIDEQDDSDVADMVEQPAKVMRIGSMIKQLLEEVRAAPLDDASRNRLREIHQSSIHELEQGLAPELREELERLSLPFSKDVTPSDAELRIAHAQLVGWLEGLFHGIQTALFAQQMAARVQLEQMRRGLPAGTATATHPGQQGEPGPRGTGQYL